MSWVPRPIRARRPSPVWALHLRPSPRTSLRPPVRGRHGFLGPMSCECSRPLWAASVLNGGYTWSAAFPPPQCRALGGCCRTPLANSASVASYQATWDLTLCCFLKLDHTRLCLSLWNPARRAGRRRRCPETINRARLKTVRGHVGGFHVNMVLTPL